jgi:hypothetical protein
MAILSSNTDISKCSPKHSKKFITARFGMVLKERMKGRKKEEMLFSNNTNLHLWASDLFFA